MSDARKAAASFGQRVRAFAFDYLVIGAYLVVLVGIGATVQARFPSVAGTLFATPTRGQVTAFCVLTLPVILYFALQESPA